MASRDWWAGIVVLALALLINGFSNRYDWQVAMDPSSSSGQALVRINRLTGEVTAQQLRLPPEITATRR